MVSGEARLGRSPAALKNRLESLSPVVPSLSEALQPFSAVVVTGGSSGIGKSFIQLGAKLKADLVFCNLSRRPPEENISPKPPGRLHHFPCDLSQPAELERVAVVVREFLAREVPTGRILLLNNSGFGAFGAFADLELARELEMIDVNVRAVVQLTGLLLPLIRARGGAILNVGSTVSFQPTPYAATYGATKAFVLHWTLALREELRGSGVQALAVCPGTTSTAFFRVAGSAADSAKSPLSMMPEQVAEAALRALTARRALVVPGWLNKLYTFAGAKLPKALAARIAGQVLSGRQPERKKT